jgi:hypothetical protein
MLQMGAGCEFHSDSASYWSFKISRFLQFVPIHPSDIAKWPIGPYVALVAETGRLIIFDFEALLQI